MKNDPIFKKPVLTALEKFVWENAGSVQSLASQLNRSEDSIHRAYARALKKVRELEAISLRGQ